ncbi:MAG: hypothetical protein WBI53_09175 [Paludibacter sp.]
MKFVRLLILLTILLTSCSKINNNLELAEQLMELAPDSSLHLLQIIESDQYMSESNRALYGLLMFQALDKNFLTLEPDTLISFSIDYYSRKSNKSRLATALFYKGRMYKYANRFEDAIPLYLNAQDQADESKDFALLGRIHNDLGEISMTGKEYGKAELEFKMALGYFDKCDFKDFIVNSLLQTGKTYYYRELHDSALWYYRKAYDQADDQVVIGRCLQDIGASYYASKQYDSAKHYLKASLKYPYFAHNKSITLYMLGDLYYDLNKIDSASLYATEALSYSPDIYTKQECYRILTNVEYLTIEKNRKPYYIKLYQSCTDSIHKLESQTKVSVFQQLHQNSREVKNTRKQYGSILFVFSFIVFVFFLITALVYRARKKKKLLLIQQQDEDRKVRRLKLSEHLKQKIDNAKNLNLKTHRVISPAERELITKNIYNEALHIDDWDFFLIEIEPIVENLTSLLPEQFPALNNKELKWCYLQLLHIDQADILTLIDYKQPSYGKFKQRIAKKLNLADASLLTDFLHKMYDEA